MIAACPNAALVAFAQHVTNSNYAHLTTEGAKRIVNHALEDGIISGSERQALNYVISQSGKWFRPLPGSLDILRAAAALPVNPCTASQASAAEFLAE